MKTTATILAQNPTNPKPQGEFGGMLHGNIYLLIFIAFIAIVSLRKN